MKKLQIEMPEERVNTVLRLKRSSHNLLNKYSIYLSDHYKKKIPESAIVDSMLENLTKDKDFKKFCNSQKDAATKADLSATV